MLTMERIQEQPGRRMEAVAGYVTNERVEKERQEEEQAKRTYEVKGFPR